MMNADFWREWCEFFVMSGTGLCTVGIVWLSQAIYWKKSLRSVSEQTTVIGFSLMMTVSIFIGRQIMQCYCG